MGDALGVGLAATQVGVLHRVLVYRADPEDELTALVNPVLEWASDELEIGEEGCLSLPGVHVEVSDRRRCGCGPGTPVGRSSRCRRMG